MTSLDFDSLGQVPGYTQPDFDSLCKSAVYATGKISLLKIEERDSFAKAAEPTEAQLAAGNYAKRKVAWHGMTISIENEAGSVRRGVDPQGNAWQTQMVFPYGYLRGTKGADDEHVDIYLGPVEDAPMVYVVHQRKYGDWSRYDEDKVFANFASEADAVHAFLLHYNDFRFLGPVTAMPVAEFVAKARATFDKPAMIKAAGVTPSIGDKIEFLDDQHTDKGPATGVVAGVKATVDGWYVTVKFSDSQQSFSWDDLQSTATRHGNLWMIKADLDFGQEMLAKSEHGPIPAGAHWITVHGSPGAKGSPILVMPHEDGSMHVIGGAGGALNHLKLRSVKTGEGYKDSIAAKQQARQAKQKEQAAADKAAGIHESKGVEKGKLKEAMKKQRNEFVQTVAEAMGWTDHKFDDTKFEGLSDEAVIKAKKDHDKELFKRAKEAVNVNRKMLLNDHDALAASGLGELPLQSKDALSVDDLDPASDKAPGLGFSASYGARAAAQGLTTEAVANELTQVHGAADNAKAAKTAEQKVAADNISKELEAFKAANPETHKPSVRVLEDATKAAALVKAQKKLKMAEQMARTASMELANAKIIESKAYVLEASDAEVEEGARKQMEQDIKTIGAAGLLSEIDKMGGEESLGGHVGAGAFNSLNAFATAVGGEPLIDRSVVDVLGINAAAQILARRISKDYQAGDFDAIKQGVEDFHTGSQGEKQDSAVAQARALHQAASEIELPDGKDGFDLAHAQELNHRRREAVNEAKRILGQATGELQANAALVMAMRQGAADKVEVSLGKTEAKAAITQMHALGLKSGDYKLDDVGGNLVATVTGDGLDRLAKPVDVEGLKQIKRNLAIIRGDMDEDGWLPQGFADRPDLAMHVEAGVAPKLAQPFQPGADLAASLRDYIGGRMADGAALQDILADAQSADFFAKAGDPAKYRAALDSVAPLRESGGLDLSASGDHVRWHATAASKEIVAGGFRASDSGGVGVGAGGTSGNTYTFKDRKDAERLSGHMQSMEDVRASEDPMSEVAKITGKSPEWIKKQGDELAYGWDGVKGKVGGRDITDRDKALHAMSVANGGYIPFHGFAGVKGEKRNFGLVPVDVSNGKAATPETDGGEQQWSPSSIKPITTPGGKLKPIDSLKESFEKMADDFVASKYGTGTSPLHRQNFEVDKKSVDALHRALSATPEGVAAFKPIGDLTPQERNGLRKWWEGNVGKKDAGADGLKSDLADHEKNEPEKESTDMFGETSTNPDWHAWKAKRDDLAGQANAAGLDWNKYVGIMGSPANAIAATQDLVRSHVVSGFADAHNKLNPNTPLKIGKTTIQGSLAHLDAVDPAARADRQAKEKELIDSLRERINGKYAGGSVADKMQAQAEANQAFEQAQMGFFSTEELGGDLFGTEDKPKAPKLGADERFTVGHAAEQKIAGMMSVVGQNFKPGKPTKLWNVSMSKQYAPQQRAIKLMEANKRVMLAYGAGSGKTNVMLGATAHLIKTGKIKRALHLVPSIVQDQYGAEAGRSLEAGQFKWHCQPGASQAERIAGYKDASNHFNVVTHESFRADMLHLGAQHAGISGEAMNEQVAAMSPQDRKAWAKSVMDKEGIDFGATFVDEAHQIVNRAGKENSARANVIDAVSDNTPYYAYSSGDPAKNDPSEVHDVLAKMDRERYGDRAAFMRKYGGDTVGAKAGLKRELARYGISNTIRPDVKADYQNITVPLSDHQRGALRDIDKTMARLAAAKSSGKVDIEAAKALSPSTFDGAPEDQHEVIAKGIAESAGIMKESAVKRVINSSEKGNSKIDKMLELADKHKGQPGVVFAHNRAAVAQIIKALEANGHKVASITGSDSAQEKARKKALFQPESGEAKADIMVCSDAAATGLNLQRGQWLVQHDVPDTAKDHGQRAARVHRLGQKNDVSVYTLASDHKSERSALRRLQKKYALRELMLDPMGGLDDSGVAGAISKRMLEKQQGGTGVADDLFKSFVGHKSAKGKRGGSLPRELAMPEPSEVRFNLLPLGKSDQFYLGAFMANFGRKWDESVELTDIVPHRRFVSKDLFTNHLTGDSKVDVAGRSAYIPYIANTIKDPDEVWIDEGGHGDRIMYCLSRFSLKNELMHIITTFKENGHSELWVGWSGFQSFVPSYYQSKRHGDRIYVRP